MEDWTHPAARAECSRSHGLSSGAVREVIPTDSHARAEQHSDNCTKAAGSQLRSVHGQWLAVQSETMSPEQLDPADDERRAKDC